MSEEKKPERQMPVMDSLDRLNMNKDFQATVLKKLAGKTKTGKLKICDWCEDDKAEWELEEHVYTDLSFNIIDDHHVDNWVSPLFRITCSNCGNTKRFDTDTLGAYVAKGNMKDER